MVLSEGSTSHDYDFEDDDDDEEDDIADGSCKLHIINYLNKREEANMHDRFKISNGFERLNFTKHRQ